MQKNIFVQFAVQLSSSDKERTEVDLNAWTTTIQWLEIIMINKPNQTETLTLYFKSPSNPKLFL